MYGKIHRNWSNKIGSACLNLPLFRHQNLPVSRAWLSPFSAFLLLRRRYENGSCVVSVDVVDSGEEHKLMQCGQQQLLSAPFSLLTFEEVVAKTCTIDDAEWLPELEGARKSGQHSEMVDFGPVKAFVVNLPSLDLDGLDCCEEAALSSAVDDEAVQSALPNGQMLIAWCCGWLGRDGLEEGEGFADEADMELDEETNEAELDERLCDIQFDCQFIFDQWSALLKKSQISRKLKWNFAMIKSEKREKPTVLRKSGGMLGSNFLILSLVREAQRGGSRQTRTLALAR